MKKKNTIGIIGGMGPSASGYLYNTINSLAISEFGAKENHDFPETILYSVPVPDFISSGKNMKIASLMLKSTIKKMNNFSLTVMGIACNTAHILLPKLQRVSQTKFISMVDEVCSVVVEKDFKRIGLLGTSSTILSSLYQKVLEANGIKVITPKKNEQKRIDTIIKSILAESTGYEDKEFLMQVSNDMKKAGAEAIILGCTELPLLFPKKYTLPIFNSVEILARALLRKYYN